MSACYADVGVAGASQPAASPAATPSWPVSGPVSGLAGVAAAPDRGRSPALGFPTTPCVPCRAQAVVRKGELRRVWPANAGFWARLPLLGAASCRFSTSIAPRSKFCTQKAPSAPLPHHFRPTSAPLPPNFAHSAHFRPTLALRCSGPIHRLASISGVLEIAILGLLKEQDMHGYELKKRLSDVFGLASAVSFGSLYPALARLEAAGAVSVVKAEDGDRDAASDASLAGPVRRASRRRKVYGITPLGAEMFEELLATSQTAGEDERTFNLRLAFARYLPPERRLGLLEQRRAVLGERLAQLAARARARRDDRYMRILAERQHESLSLDVSWLDRLIQEERAGGATPGPSGPAATAAGAVRCGLGHGAGSATASRPEAPSPPAARLVPLASASQLQRAARGLAAPGTRRD